MIADIRVRDLTVEYVSGEYAVRPIDGFDLDAGSGELVVLLGPSGCGKTTLLSCLAGILTPTAGSITVGSSEVTELRGDELTAYRQRTVGIVFQAFNLIPSLTALENTAVPLTIAGVPGKKARPRAAELLETVGLSDRAGHLPSELSGGQQQRVAIARALAHDPPVLLADEPTAHLDYIQVEAVLRLLRELASPGRIVVVATHDDRFVPLADRTIDLMPKVATEHRVPERVSLDPGSVLFRQGDRGELIYVVDEGAIDIVRARADGTEEHLTTVGSGGYFGELAPLLGIPRSATARARTRATLTGFTVADFREKAAVDPSYASFLRTARGLVAEPTPPTHGQMTITEALENEVR